MNERELKQRTKQFALNIIHLVEELTDSTVKRVVGYQLMKSGTSVGANYRAACRARSKAEFTAKLGICDEEADESAYWLELIREADVLPLSRISDLLKEAEELAAIFTSSRKTAARNNKKY